MHFQFKSAFNDAINVPQRTHKSNTHQHVSTTGSAMYRSAALIILVWVSCVCGMKLLPDPAAPGMVMGLSAGLLRPCESLAAGSGGFG